MVGVTDQFTVSTARGQLNVQLTSATNRFENDIRYSRSVLPNNTVSDSSAPSNDDSWNSGASQLVLGTTARDDANEPLGSGYTDELDNIIYYINSDTLYRRLLANPDSSNRYEAPTTCPQTSTGGCSDDTAILHNVDSFNLTYYDSTGGETTDYSSVENIKVDITLKIDESRQDISLNGSSTFRLFEGTTASPPTGGGGPSGPIFPPSLAPLTAGYGGLSMSSAGLELSPTVEIVSYGDLSISEASYLWVGGISLGHKNCGTGSNYGSSCPSSPAPGIVDGSALLVQGIVCGPTLPVVTGNILAGTQTTDCDVPGTPPTINKEVLTKNIPTANTLPGQTCSSISNPLTLQANYRYTGDVTMASYCTTTVQGEGVIYIDGDLTMDNSYVDIESGSSDVIFAVNGKVTIENGSGFAGSSSNKSTIVSFDSANSSCSGSSDCNTLSNSDLYSSRNRVAVDISSSAVRANLYAPFARISIDESTVESKNIFGQGVTISNLEDYNSLDIAP